MIGLMDRINAGLPVSQWVGRVRAHHQRKAHMRALERVDTATLRDIGMSRAELMSVCFGDAEGRRHGHV